MKLLIIATALSLAAGQTVLPTTAYNWGAMSTALPETYDWNIGSTASPLMSRSFDSLSYPSGWPTGYPSMYDGSYGFDDSYGALLSNRFGYSGLPYASPSPYTGFGTFPNAYPTAYPSAYPTAFPSAYPSAYPYSAVTPDIYGGLPPLVEPTGKGPVKKILYSKTLLSSEYFPSPSPPQILEVKPDVAINGMSDRFPAQQELINSQGGQQAQNPFLGNQGQQNPFLGNQGQQKPQQQGQNPFDNAGQNPFGQQQQSSNGQSNSQSGLNSQSFDNNNDDNSDGILDLLKNIQPGDDAENRFADDKLNDSKDSNKLDDESKSEKDRRAVSRFNYYHSRH